MYKAWTLPDNYKELIDRKKKYLRFELQEALEMSPSVFNRVFRANSLWLAKGHPEYIGQRIIQYSGDDVLEYLESLENPRAEAKLILDYYGSDRDFEKTYEGRSKIEVFSKETCLYYSGITDWI